MDGGNKKETKVLSANEIRERARNWSLAGDAGLLAHLEQFSEKIITKTQDTNSQLNELVESYEEVNKKVNNVTNQFLALQNCQFVENRVYDEETPTEENIKEKVVTESEKERLLLQQYKEAVDIGVKLLDTHFEAVELPPNSDSDDEDEEISSGNASLMWRPKNPYSAKKFPALIGSSEWWEDDKVGLGDPDENSVAEKGGESDVETDLEGEDPSGRKEIHASSSSSLDDEKFSANKSKASIYESSEDLFGFDRNNAFKASDSDLFGVAKGESFQGEEPDVFSRKFDKEDVPNIENPETASIKENTPQKPNKLDLDFTRELAAKLGNFTKDSTKSSPITDKSPKPVEREGRVVRSENLFEDEDGDNTDLFNQKTPEKTKIGKGGLFFEEENDSDLFGESNKLFGEPETDLFDSDNLAKSQTVSDRGDKLTPSKKSPSPIKVSREKNTTNLFADLGGEDENCDRDDEDDDDEESLFGSRSATKSHIISRSSDQSGSIFPKTPPVQDAVKKTGGTERSKGLFDEDSDDSDIFQSKSTKKPIASTFLAVESDDDSADLFSTKPRIKETEKPSREALSRNAFDVGTGGVPGNDAAKGSVFAEDMVTDPLDERKGITPKAFPALDHFDEEASLFLEKPKPQDATSISSSRSSLFDDVPASKSRLASVFEKDKASKFEDDLLNSSDDLLFGGGSSVAAKNDEDDLFSTSTARGMKFGGNEKRSLFDDFEDDEVEEDDGSDLFKGSEKQEKVSTGERAETATVAVASVKTIKKLSENLFGEDVKDSIDEMTREEEEEDLFNGISNTTSFLNCLEAEMDDLFGVVATAKPVEKVSSQSARADPTRKLEEVERDVPKEKSSPVPPTTTKTEAKSLPPDSNDLFFDRDPLKVSSSTDKPKPPDSLNLRAEAGKGKIVGKLNIPSNLKTRLEASVKQVSSDGGHSVGLRKPTVHIEEGKKEEEVPAAEPNPYEPSSNLLKCPSKDRVKIPGRRRPQSRRARQEAIRNSGVNFLDGESEVPVPERSSSPPSDKRIGDVAASSSSSSDSKNVIVTREKGLGVSPEPHFPKSHPLSPSTDEEDIFNVPGLDTNFESEDHDLFKRDIFEPKSDNGTTTDNSLFGGGPVLSPLGEKKDGDLLFEGKEEKADPLFSSSPPQSDSVTTKPQSIFNFDDKDGLGGDDDDEDDGLFTSKSFTGGNKGKKSEHFLTASGAFMQGMKKPLFDDGFGKEVEDDDDDDLFGKPFEIPGKQSTTTPLADKERKLPAEDTNASKSVPFVDPLGLMSNKDDS